MWEMNEDEVMRKYAEAHGCGEKVALSDEHLKQLLEDMEPVRPVRPLPCVRDEHGEIQKQNIKMLYAKINEELDEFKSAVNGWRWYVATDERTKEKESDWKNDIAEEAADTITAITTMLEALGIDAEARDKAQRRVNAKNRERKRL